MPVDVDVDTPRPLTVASVRPVSTGVVELVLRDPGGGPLPAWTPGSHVALQVGPGVVRQYSLCGATEDAASWRVAVLREPASRGGSAALCEDVRAGDVILTTGPRNHFELEEASGYLFIAGGIGITAILPMLRQAEAAGADWRLVYGGRAEASMAYRDEVRAVAPERVVEWPQDRCGLIDLEALLGVPRPGTLVYCCGPEPLIAAVEAGTAHWPRGSLRTERFAPRPDADLAPTAAFEVELRDSDAVLLVPADRSILEVVDEAGIYVLSNCEEGTCGTCQTTVLEGLPDHRDSILDEDERAAGDTMMICVSRSRSPRLVLDL